MVAIKGHVWLHDYVWTLVACAISFNHKNHIFDVVINRF
jgi:hypothetical protein